MTNLPNQFPEDLRSKPTYEDLFQALSKMTPEARARYSVTLLDTKYESCSGLLAILSAGDIQDENLRDEAVEANSNIEIYPDPALLVPILVF